MMGAWLKASGARDRVTIATKVGMMPGGLKPDRIRENFEVSVLPEDAMQEIRTAIAANIRFNSVVGTGVPGFIPRDR